MRQINVLGDQPKQNVSVVLVDGSTVSITVEFWSNQKGWFYSTSHAPTDFQDLNRRMVSSPNMLRAFRKFIPFGIACVVSDLGEPWLQSDFLSGRVKLYLIDQDDLAQVEEIIENA